MSVTIGLEGFEAFAQGIASAASELEADLLEGSYDAAKYGVTSMQENHPYQDRTTRLTNDMHVEGATAPDGMPEAEIVVPAEYAKYVDEGTSRAQPYPFMSLGEHAAGEALETNTARAVERFSTKVSR